MLGLSIRGRTESTRKWGSRFPLAHPSANFLQTKGYPLPASRSRTQEWRRSLRQIHERGGAIEFTIAQPENEKENDPASHASGADLVWRVKIIQLDDKEIVKYDQNKGI